MATAVAYESHRLLKPGEVAKQLGVHPATVYRLAARGELPAVRVGRSVRIDAAKLATFLEGSA